MKKILFVAAIVLSAVACEKKEEERRIGGESFRSEHYINIYMDGPIEVDLRGKSIGFSLSYPGDVFYTSEAKGGENLEEFLRIAERHGDTEYEGRIPCNPPFHNACCAVDIREVHVTCDEAYDERHPAGALLDDIMAITYSTFAPFIECGYRRFFYPEFYGGDKFPYTYRLNKLLPTDLRMLSWDNLFSLGFMSLPSEPDRSYTFTIDIVPTEGATRSLTVTCIPAVPAWTERL